MPHRRTVFVVSDRTGITAEMLGHSLLSQFEGLEFRRVTLPFIDSPEKAQQAAAQIRAASENDHERPIVFSSMVNEGIRSMLKLDCALNLDFFEAFIAPLERELGCASSHTVGKAHSVANFNEYNARIEAVNFSMAHDDGIKPRDLAEADIILVGVSRSGKTPTCLYMALQFGIKAANYPLIPEDLGEIKLPAALAPYRHKLFGLTIAPDRLAQIRTERKPNSKYASIDNCKFETAEVEAIFRREGVPYINTTSKSVEEISSTILHQAKLERKVF
ncbi:pyruvate, water dikinase regulatory protein [Chitinivorax sp. B]|uniref:posphoenolpyruvate synthetase regulatory kinase/phosphorylase PpsR n=1 Tax=Chitinivorax sp. B TaxID=2502235 RepID=UPI0010F79F7C|nr:pyruvate, water dikinase regulatory protein [Chitinivorax sp. B]